MKSMKGWRGKGIRPRHKRRDRCTCHDLVHGSHLGVVCTRMLFANSSIEEGICGLCVSDMKHGSNRRMSRPMFVPTEVP